MSRFMPAPPGWRFLWWVANEPDDYEICGVLGFLRYDAASELSEETQWETTVQFVDQDGCFNSLVMPVKCGLVLFPGVLARRTDDGWEIDPSGYKKHISRPEEDWKFVKEERAKAENDEVRQQNAATKAKNAETNAQKEARIAAEKAAKLARGAV